MNRSAESGFYTHVLLCSLALVLAAPPQPPPAPAGELPHWRSVAEPPPAKPRPKPGVPSTGAGFISLGSILIGGGTIALAAAIGQATTDDIHGEDALGLFSGFAIGSGATLLVIGTVIRRQFRASPAAAIPNAPRTGAGMQLGGLGLMTGGSGFVTFAASNLAGACQNCGPFYVKGAVLSLGFGLASVAVGSGLMIGGATRRGKYKAWAESRVAGSIAPTFAVGASGVHFGVAGRF